MTKFYSRSRRIQVAQVRRTTANYSQVGRNLHEIRGARGAAEPSVPVPAGASFYAPLTENLTELVADYASTFTRGSDGWYWDGSAYQVAGNNVARFEPDGLLMEPDITNLCTNYNANPDAALSNMIKGGDAAGVLSRVSDSAALSAAGLGSICSSGFVFQLDNSGGSADACVDVAGGTTAAVHTASAFANKVSGSGSSTIGFSAGTVSSPITANAYDRVYASGTTVTAETLRITAGIGDVIRFVLNQSEVLPLATSPIITQGASASRSNDLLSYAGAQTFVPSSPRDVTFLIEWTPKWVTGIDRFGLLDATGIFVIFPNAGRGPSIISTTTERLQNRPPDGPDSRVNYDGYGQEIIRVASRNGEGAQDVNIAVRYSVGTRYGTTVQGTDYDNDDLLRIVYSSGTRHPCNVKNLIIYPELKTDTWLDENWLCDGCFPP